MSLIKGVGLNWLFVDINRQRFSNHILFSASFKRRAEWECGNRVVFLYIHYILYLLNKYIKVPVFFKHHTMKARGGMEV